MNLNHLNLTVTDVPATVAFLQTYFQMRQQAGNARMAFLSDGRDFFLSLFQAAGETVSYPADFHIGFYVDSEATVDALQQRLQADGYDAPPPSQDHGYKFYVPTPGGFRLEVSYNPWQEQGVR